MTPPRKPDANPFDSAKRVTIALGKHALGPDAARSAYVVGQILARLTQQTGHEHAAMIDAVTGSIAGEVIEGTEHTTNITPHLARTQMGGRYTHLHTHPAGTSFSEPDLVLFFDVVEIAVVAVLDASGGWYILSEHPGTEHDGRTMLLLLREEERLLWPNIRERVAAGDIRWSEARATVRHQAIQRLAERAGLRYDHVSE